MIASNPIEPDLFISRSTMNTESNKTGAWRFVRPEYTEKRAPCNTACPAGEDIPRIEFLAAKGFYQDAWNLILQENPFPAVCGRVCFHPCERYCNRNEFDNSVAIHRIERFIGDSAISEDWISEIKPAPVNGKRIAIAGSGPAGLSAACFLTRLGFQCVIFESETDPGGLLRWGIPEYRLPKIVLNKEIQRIKMTGVEIRTGVGLPEELFLNPAAENFDGLFPACGYGKAIPLGLKQESGIEDGLRFLRRIRKEGSKFEIKGRAAVIGGGNTAVDTARTLVRLGADAVIVYRRRIEDMPAFGSEIEAAKAEGVSIMELVAPISVEKTGEQLALNLQKMKPVPGHPGERALIEPDGGETEIITVDRVFAAIGAEPADNRLVIPEKESSDMIRLSHCVLIEQNVPVIFGGDLATPIKSVADAILSGKQAAIAFDAWFKGGKESIREKIDGCIIGDGPSLSMSSYLNGPGDRLNRRIVNFGSINTDYFEKAARIAPGEESPDKRKSSFMEVENTASETDVRYEAGRCFNCGVCTDCDICRVFCPELSIIVSGGVPGRRINTEYCKGCGICVTECPRCAMELKEETL